MYSDLAFELIIQMVGGAVGGGLAGYAARDDSYVFRILGAIGGAVGGQIIAWLIPDLSVDHGVDLDHLIGIASGGALSGAVLTLAFIKLTRRG